MTIWFFGFLGKWYPQVPHIDGVFPVSGLICTTNLLLPQAHLLANTEMLKFAVNIFKIQYVSNKRTETNMFFCIKEHELPLELPETLTTIKLVAPCIVFAGVYF